jgi:hypothetical protein
VSVDEQRKAFELIDGAHTSTFQGELPEAALAEIAELGSFDSTRPLASPVALFRSR